jgi:AraC family transcriptional regulator of adaptative response/methylated-DNA-[protein]-cysteine methyltransferase
MTKTDRFADVEARWNAVVHRDQSAEGVFYYAVRTTGVYCRPGCSSRLPARQNVEFFDTQQEAELAGYRPCKRCAPDTVSPNEQLRQLIVQACRRLEESAEPLKLNDLAREAALSPWHFHRLFTKIVGVTPKQYAAAQQRARLRDTLKTSRSVTEAIYDAGFNSGSRVYEQVDDLLAMTPSTYRRGGAGLTIRYGIAPCFLGWIGVAATERGICSIEFGDDPHDLPARIQRNFPSATLEEAGAEFSAMIQTVVAFIEKPERSFGLPLDIQGTAFQRRVWSALREVPPGVTVSYAEIADRIGSPAAVRAVAQACAANKLAVAIPCHRAVRKDGELAGYRWGIARKQTLLTRESTAPAVSPARSDSGGEATPAA